MADVAGFSSANSQDVAGIIGVLNSKPPSFAAIVPGNTQTMLDSAEKDKNALSDLSALKGALGAFDQKSLQHGVWVAVFLAEAAREDPNVLDWCAKAWGDSKANADASYNKLASFIKACSPESLGADKAAFLLTALVVRDDYFKSYLSGEIFKVVLAHNLSQTGKIDALCNLLRVQSERQNIWETYAAPLVKNVTVGSAPPLLYKSCFSIWLMSFAPVTNGSGWVLKLLKDVLVSCRVEKIVRVALMSLQNFLKSKPLAKDVVEVDSLQALTALEYEKWRDPDVYDLIKAVKEMVEAETSKYTNFDRYMSELQSGDLSWSFIHTEKFWLENVNKFDQNDFAAVKLLCELIGKSQNATSLAVACHDVGEFARLFPAGKRVCKRYGAQGLVMEKMNHFDRQVAREALLCTQKLMLHKWQEVAVE